MNFVRVLCYVFASTVHCQEASNANCGIVVYIGFDVSRLSLTAPTFIHDGREKVGRRERIQSTLSKTDTFELLWEPALSVHLRGSNKGSKERRGPTLGLRFTEVSVKRESTVIGYFRFHIFK